MSQDTLTQTELKQQLHYDPYTGDFTRLVSNSGRVRAGSIAGCINAQGYNLISINYKRYLSHRLAFLWMTGAFPENMVDHINHKRAYNRWVNLRAATRSENLRNSRKRSDNTSGCKGVYFNKGAGKYVARIMANGVKKHLGLFDTPEEAHQVYCQAADKHYGKFAYHGKRRE